MAGKGNFLKIDGVLGDSTDPTHMGWIDVASWMWLTADSSSVGNSVGPGGSRTNTVALPPILFYLESGTMALKLHDYLYRGPVFERVTLESWDPTGGTGYRQIFTGVEVSGWRTASPFHSNNTPQYAVELSMAKAGPPFGIPFATGDKSEYSGLLHESPHGRKPIPSNHNETLVRDR